MLWVCCVEVLCLCCVVSIVMLRLLCCYCKCCEYCVASCCQNDTSRVVFSGVGSLTSLSKEDPKTLRPVEFDLPRLVSV